MNIPQPILKISKIIILDESSYQINNLDLECEFLLFNKLEISLGNLPFNLKVIWLENSINIENLEIKYFISICK
jgi:hypothetical protein